MTKPLHFDDLTPKQRGNKLQGRVSEYGFVLTPQTRVVGKKTQSTHVYKKVPDEVTNKGRVVTWKRVWVWSKP